MFNEAIIQTENLLPNDLINRDIRQRFSAEEKVILAPALHRSWNERLVFNRAEAEIISLRNGNCAWGHYPDNEAFAVITPQGRNLQPQVQGNDLYAVVNLEDDRDVVATRAILNGKLRPRSVIIGTMYFPYQRGDRPELRGVEGDDEEIVIVETLIQDMATAKVKGMVVVDSHSPAFSWYALRHGISILDISALPSMVNVARQNGLFEGYRLVAAGGDDGALEMGYAVGELVGTDTVVTGNKSKYAGKTTVSFSEDDLALVDGSIVVIGEDIISTGGTMSDSINKLLNAGAERVVILATYPIFADKALERLGFNPKVKIITTDGRIPQSVLHTSENIIVVPTIHKIESVLKLDKQGTDFWSQEGNQALTDLGFCLSPWQMYDLTGRG
jgi:phosphoribosylpyrophosphate synthetase